MMAAIAAVTIKVNTIGEQRVSARAIPDYYYHFFPLGLLLIREHARAFSKVIEQQMGESGYYKFAALSTASSSCAHRKKREKAISIGRSRRD